MYLVKSNLLDCFIHRFFFLFPALKADDWVALLLIAWFWTIQYKNIKPSLSELLHFTYLHNPRWRCTLRQAVRHSLGTYRGFLCGAYKKESGWLTCPAFGERSWCSQTGRSFDRWRGPLAEIVRAARCVSAVRFKALMNNRHFLFVKPPSLCLLQRWSALPRTQLLTLPVRLNQLHLLIASVGQRFCLTWLKQLGVFINPQTIVHLRPTVRARITGTLNENRMKQTL